MSRAERPSGMAPQSQFGLQLSLHLCEPYTPDRNLLPMHALPAMDANNPDIFLLVPDIDPAVRLDDTSTLLDTNANDPTQDSSRCCAQVSRPLQCPQLSNVRLWLQMY